MKFVLLLLFTPLSAQIRIIPHITIEGRGFTSQLILANTGTATANYSLTPYDLLGKPGETKSGSLAAGTTEFHDKVALFGEAEVSHVTVEADESLFVSVVYQAELPQSAPVHLHETTLQSTLWRFYPGNWDLVWDGLAAVNMGFCPATVTVAQLAADGTPLAEATATTSLVALGKVTYVVGPGFQAAADSYFEIRADQPLAITVLRGALDGTLLWENRALALGEASAAVDSEALLAIDVHAHLDAYYLSQGALVSDYEAAAANALSIMDGEGIQRALLIPPPFTSHNTFAYDYTDLAAVAAGNPDRFAFGGGGGLLNPLLHDTPAESVTQANRDTFTQLATTIHQAGAAAFGEMAALHLSFFEGHDYLEVAPDHPLLLLLADLAAGFNMPIDLHMEAVIEDMALPEFFSAPPNPATLPANIEAFERLLTHNREARIVWVHVGWDNTGDMTPGLMRRLLETHENLYLGMRAPDRPPFQFNLPVINGVLQSDWVELIEAFPDRFLMAVDEFYGIPGVTPERVPSAAPTRDMLNQLSAEVACKVFLQNAGDVYGLDN